MAIKAAINKLESLMSNSIARLKILLSCFDTKASAKPSINPRDVFDTALSFHQASICLADAVQPPIRFQYLPAGIVSQAFACELYFKCLILLETGRTERGHHLHALYRQLSTASKKVIEAEWDAIMVQKKDHYDELEKVAEMKIPRNFKWAIESGTESFRELRYLFEKPHSKTQFILGDLPHILFKLILTRMPSWKP